MTTAIVDTAAAADDADRRAAALAYLFPKQGSTVAEVNTDELRSDLADVNNLIEPPTFTAPRSSGSAAAARR